MIDNQTRYHRKRIKLSQKEIEKRLAHGLKSDGYEEYEDYTQTMYKQKSYRVIGRQKGII